jgi:hypothetical protein
METSALTAPGDKGGQVISAAVSMIALSTLAVALRLVSRRFAKRAACWWDDWLALFALVSYDFP